MPIKSRSKQEADEVLRRHLLQLSNASPWNRSNSDPELNIKHPGPSSSLCQFKSSIENIGDLEFKPEYREMYVAYPTCALPPRSKHARTRSVAGIEDMNDTVGTREYQSQESLNNANTSLKLEGENQFLPEYRDQYRDYSILYRRTSKSPAPPVTLKSEGDFEFLPEYQDKFKDHIIYRRSSKSPAPPVTLKSEGDFEFLPEYQDKYKDYKIYRRSSKSPVPPVSLRVEGDQTFDTEHLTQFRPYTTSLKRRELIRNHTQLEIPTGCMFYVPEYKASFIDFPRQRPIAPRLKMTQVAQRPTSLNLNGTSTRQRTMSEASLTPEYRAEFVDFPRQRPEFPRPTGTLTPEGPWHGKSPEYRAEFVDFPRQRPETKKQIASLKPFGGVNDNCHEYRQSYKDFPRKRPQVKKPKENLKSEGDMAGNAEYREKYLDFPRQRPVVKKTPENLKTEGKLSGTAEYRANFKDFPRQRPVVKKTPTNLKPEGDFADHYAEYKENFKDSPRYRPKVPKPNGNLKPEGQFLDKDEYRENYVAFPRERPKVPKPIVHLKTEGEFIDKDEYRANYVDFPRERPKVPKPIENLKSEGEILDKDEYRDKYVDFSPKRPDIAKANCSLKPEGPWMGRFPEYRAAFIDLPRHRPIVPKPPNELSEPDTLGGGYCPKSDRVRPKTANYDTPAAGLPTGQPMHVKRSGNLRARYLGRPGHLPEAKPTDREPFESLPELNKGMLGDSRRNSTAYLYKEEDVTTQAGKRPRVNVENSEKLSSFHIVDAPLRAPTSATHANGILGKFGTGSIVRCPYSM